MTDIYGLSDVGCIRELNEDCFCTGGFDEHSENGFCILADGMGGHNAGEVASQSAVSFIADELRKLSDKKNPEIPKSLNDAVSDANIKIYKMSLENTIHSGMGTTVVIAYVDDGTVYVANVGDSRAYAVRGDKIKQITTDHSVVAELVRCGTITPQEARVHPQRNIITRAVGTDREVNADVFEYDYSKGDVLLLCSDGLSTMVEDEKICEIIKNEKTSEDMAGKLVELAKENGGIDNITVICIRFV